MKKDLVIGIVGTLILLTAMVGVFRFEAGQRGASFDLTWETSSAEAATLDGGTNEGESTEGALNLTHLNVTRVEFVLEWTDEQANTGPDEFNLTVTSPDGVTRSAQADNGRLSVVFEDLARVPEDARLLGSDEAAARDQAMSTYANRAAVGAWNVTVTLVQAGDTTPPGGPVPAPVSPLQDAANSWALSAVVTMFEARLTAA